MPSRNGIHDRVPSGLLILDHHTKIVLKLVLFLVLLFLNDFSGTKVEKNKL